MYLVLAWPFGLPMLARVSHAAWPASLHIYRKRQAYHDAVARASSLPRHVGWLAILYQLPAKIPKKKWKASWGAVLRHVNQHMIRLYVSGAQCWAKRASPTLYEKIRIKRIKKQQDKAYNWRVTRPYREREQNVTARRITYASADSEIEKRKINYNYQTTVRAFWHNSLARS